jgi:hypothetical protein
MSTGSANVVAVIGIRLPSEMLDARARVAPPQVKAAATASESAT